MSVLRTWMNSLSKVFGSANRRRPVFGQRPLGIEVLEPRQMLAASPLSVLGGEELATMLSGLELVDQPAQVAYEDSSTTPADLAIVPDPGAVEEEFHFVIYDDQVINDWRPTAFTATVNFASRDLVHDGESAIAITFTGATARLSLDWLGAFPRTLDGYDRLSFWVHGGTAGSQLVRVGFSDENQTRLFGPVFEAGAGQWTRIEMPFSEIGDPEAIRSIFFLSATGAQPTFYLDDITLVGPGSPGDLPAAPSDPNWGINLFNHAEWGFEGAFVDVTKTWSAWGPDQSTSPPEWTLPWTDQGVPREDFAAVFYLRSYPGGIYQLRFEGTADVQFAGDNVQIVDGSLRIENGVTYADVQIDRPEFDSFPYLAPPLWVYFRNVDPEDPVRNLRMVAPGYELETTQVYRDEFLDKLEPFSTIRFMQFNLTNRNIASDWSLRRQPDEVIQIPGGDPQGGVAWEYLIAMANEAGKNAWLNIPFRADDQYIRELARLWRDQLDPSLKLYVEFDNELWNLAFSAGQEVNGDYYGVVAPRLLTISTIFHEEFGLSSDRFEIILSGRSEDDQYVVRALEYFEDNGIEPNTVIDALAIAPYLYLESQEVHSDLNVIFDELMSMEDEARGVRQHRRIAEYYGLELYAYEGGVSLGPREVANTDLWLAVHHDPRMGEVYRTYAQMWQDNSGGGLFQHFTLVGGTFGLLEDIRDPGSVKWDAVLSVIVDAGDATLDGRVAYEDFVVLRDHYGTGVGLTGEFRWWEQGDFTGDNRVDSLDGELFLGNLDPGLLSSAEKIEIERFFGVTFAAPIDTVIDPTVEILPETSQPTIEGTTEATTEATIDATTGPTIKPTIESAIDTGPASSVRANTTDGRMLPDREVRTPVSVFEAIVGMPERNLLPSSQWRRDFESRPQSGVNLPWEHDHRFAASIDSEAARARRPFTLEVSAAASRSKPTPNDSLRRRVLAKLLDELANEAGLLLDELPIEDGSPDSEMEVGSETQSDDFRLDELFSQDPTFNGR